MKAWFNSSLVFITIGPPHAIGCFSGFPVNKANKQPSWLALRLMWLPLVSKTALFSLTSWLSIIKPFCNVKTNKVSSYGTSYSNIAFGFKSTIKIVAFT